MDSVRCLSTIGIEGFVCGPSDPLPNSYLALSSGDAPPTETSSFTSWEITGKVKEKPEDFVVREILPKNDVRYSKLWSHYAAMASGAPSTSKGDNDPDAINKQPLNIATIPSIPSFQLSSTPDESVNQSKGNPLNSKETNEPPRKKTIVGEKIPSPKGVATISKSSSGNASVLPEVSLETTIRVYIKNVATSENPAAVLLKSIEELSEKAIHRIPTCQNDNTTPASATPTSDGDAEVWIPPLYLQKDLSTNGAEKSTKGPTSEAEMKAQRKAFHRAIRISYPFLKTESASPSTFNEISNKSNTNHWIKITIDNCFDELVEYLYTPRDDLKQLFLFRNWGFEGAPPQLKSTNAGSDVTKSESYAVLKLRPGVSKDDRRSVHHILALKNKHFETSIRNQGSKTKNASKPIPKEAEEKSENTTKEVISPPTTDLVVTWKKQALRKGSYKNKKRKRFENGKESDYKSDGHLLCILKKTQKEHLTAMQILSRSLRCRQGDIGFAGIKDMKAITYQFVTLRNMGQNRAERAICQQLRNRDVELKILCSNVDFVLNIGDLEGNHFEISVHNLKRIKVDNGISELAKESFVECDKNHIDKMVERIKQHGFINFYGEQRIGAPGTSEEVGVRAFDIGRAMLRKDFKGAIDLLMKGTRHNETDEARRVRQAWKDSNGNPSTTLKAFGKADIMPRERAILRGLNRYPGNPLEAIRFLSYNMRIFYINAYQSYVFNKVASRRVKLHGETVMKGDLYFEKDGDHRDNIRVVQGNEEPPISISQIVFPLPGYSVQYPTNELGEFYQDLLDTDGVKFEKNGVPEATANGSYRKLIVHPKNLSADTGSSDASCGSMKLSFQLPKGCYATMLLRELMLTTVVRP